MSVHEVSISSKSEAPVRKYPKHRPMMPWDFPNRRSWPRPEPNAGLQRCFLFFNFYFSFFFFLSPTRWTHYVFVARHPNIRRYAKVVSGSSSATLEGVKVSLPSRPGACFRCTRVAMRGHSHLLGTLNSPGIPVPHHTSVMAIRSPRPGVSVNTSGSATRMPSYRSNFPVGLDMARRPHALPRLNGRHFAQ